MRAPPELMKIAPMGKSPILVVPGIGPIIESSAIITYLLRTYDTSKRFASSDWLRDETLVSFAGATLGPLSAIELLFDLAAKHTPWPLVYIPRKIRKSMQNFFTHPEFVKTMSYLEAQLGENMWFNGKELGRSDVMLSWPLDMIAHRKWVDLEKDYPLLAAWRLRIQERPAWKKGLERGNGYDLGSW
jgi:glutathione S-transferase